MLPKCGYTAEKVSCYLQIPVISAADLETRC